MRLTLLNDLVGAIAGTVLAGARSMLIMKILFVLLCSASYLILSSAQQCSKEDLTDEMVATLLAESLAAGQTDPPTIDVLQTNIVCLTTATIFGNYQFVSIVVSYRCSMSIACPAGMYRIFTLYYSTLL